MSRRTFLETVLLRGKLKIQNRERLLARRIFIGWFYFLGAGSWTDQANYRLVAFAFMLVPIVLDRFVAATEMALFKILVAAVSRVGDERIGLVTVIFVVIEGISIGISIGATESQLVPNLNWCHESQLNLN